VEQAAVDTFLRAKVSSIVPAAPELPSTLPARLAVTHRASPAAVVEVLLVEELLVELDPGLPVVDGALLLAAALVVVVLLVEVEVELQPARTDTAARAPSSDTGAQRIPPPSPRSFPTLDLLDSRPRPGRPRRHPPASESATFPPRGR
jgi:hypothetical protein